MHPQFREFHSAQVASAELPIAPGTMPAAATTVLRRAFSFVWLERPRRVLLALTTVWVLHLFDLCFTMRESQELHFVELNPIAAKLLAGPEHWIISYKFALVTLGSAILLLLRRHSITELASWFLAAVSVYVAARWYVYFQCLIDDRYSPFVAIGGP
ncbi:MAG: hypothetical protein HRU75_13885 [Planctomycetia bacterium]|nr:MAG: hypothetical protein HRU75_13885 [Planctomycetia bacterium]